ncbi:hypothetical protein [Methylobacterium nonmethylotrophicum]|uniref:Uncharacterized protein n=1 Tax=Methylobacterium nonmethylotrophicum TaxID=1141884 RepID=A0A4Z0NVE2_9HYPH|nr:hypothetical protein [Methylobacterium nonmethylotrophicum]TGE01012.1 hypothetical protein EU555_05235 [Methylobacterium nonmethylotrophicum]
MPERPTTFFSTSKQLSARATVPAFPSFRSGLTSMACGIATEFACKGVSVRYLNFDELLERAAVADSELTPPLPGPANIGYWPRDRAQVLVIDNLGPFLGTSSHQGGDGESEDRLKTWLGKVQTALSTRHTLWIMGKVGAETVREPTASDTAIGRFLGIDDPAWGWASL